MRMFIGIPLPLEHQEAIARAMRHLPLPQETFRRSRPEGWHITLQFLGEVTLQQSECLVSQLQEISSQPARLQITSFGWIGTGILAAHVEPIPELMRLAEKVTAATRLCGFQPEERPWRPHVTLARRKSKARLGRSDLALLQTDMEESFSKATRVPSQKCFVREFCLFESFSNPEGQRYSVRAHFPMERQH